MIEIVAPGPLASVQDLGRRGHRAIGVGVSGAMDRLALLVGNLLLGNDAGSAGIEFTLGAFQVRFEQAMAFALTGADCGATLDGIPLPPWWCGRAEAGQLLAAGPAHTGMRAYLAVAGGLDVAAVLGSRSTDLKAGFGGHQGRQLTPGDRIPCLAPEPEAGRAARFPPAGFGVLPPELVLSDGLDAAETAVRVIPAAEYGIFMPEAQEAFWSAAWQVHPDSNRIGYRLTGPTLAAREARELLSHGIVPGVVQVPPSGQPVIQMSDANTAGGYPKMGVVISADLRRLAQLRLGGTLRFVRATQEEAVAALHRESAYVARIARLAKLATQVV
ncbi:biotin-dependent carboxyltransferase family protein [Methylobacterium nodulans]|uniref:Urea amidolyase related protein n=1 Tax=Methylobacterium nodulans (strain LMG 21967 / CNCM I-2342 / ORS 2060) TaxID=460265 RepID=B8IGM2_METNO|nr:biotin-dependent carboxyltransferase family protein [Methylobacterium nodulans]ACL55922.1 urea amidolyase related protein [Methylobacterium nodulans ORS 2060]